MRFLGAGRNHNSHKVLAVNLKRMGLIWYGRIAVLLSAFADSFLYGIRV